MKKETKEREDEEGEDGRGKGEAANTLGIDGVEEGCEEGSRSAVSSSGSKGGEVDVVHGRLMGRTRHVPWLHLAFACIQVNTAAAVVYTRDGTALPTCTCHGGAARLTVSSTRPFSARTR